MTPVAEDEIYISTNPLFVSLDNAECRRFRQYARLHPELQPGLGIHHPIVIDELCRMRIEEFAQIQEKLKILKNQNT